MTIDPYEVGLLLVGLAALVAAWVPGYLTHRALSLPVILVAIGAVIFALPLGLPNPDPRGYPEFVERFTEFAVIISLMGAGLKIDRPFAWRTWSNTWRMLAIAMPLTIAATALFGAFVGGLSGVSALLLGSVIAPTDPVLASDVQVGEPTLDKEPAPDAEDEVRFTLTSEGGLNDALAFPFVYLAILIAEHGWAPSGWAAEWIGVDVIWRVAVGLLIGWGVGRILAIVSFRPPGPLSALADTPQGFFAVAATLIAYGATELFQGYGFLAVFVAAVVIRSSERRHEFHAEMHGFIDQLENILVVALLLVLGGSLVSGLLDGLTWGGAAVAVAVVFIVRPISGWLALIGSKTTETERWAIAFFGIRGFGTVYYLAYAISTTHFGDGDELWAIVALTITVSVAAHGITASPMMRLVDRSARRRRRGVAG